MIGSRFEVDASKATCRLAFYGRLAGLIETSDPQQMRKLRIFKVKRRTGSIDRVNKDGLSAVCKGMFKKETDISVFVGLKVVNPTNCRSTLSSGLCEPLALQPWAALHVYQSHMCRQCFALTCCTRPCRWSRRKVARAQ